MADDPSVKFVIGGVQKGGTTALFEHLRGHPALQMAACKEVHFFDREGDVDWSAPDYAAYHAAFHPPDGRLRGEATPIYLYWPESLPRMRAYDPRMRLIFLFRDPVERAYSHWKMEMARGYDDRPFSWAIRQGRARVDDPAAPGHHRVYSYVERGFYAAQIERAYALFAQADILLLDSQALGTEPDAVLDQVCRFLGVPGFEGPQGAVRANVGPEPGRFPPMSADDRAYLGELYAEDQRRFAQMTGLALAGARR
ncbi:sulfotransferase domain-containing protein [Methylobacterium trifolii]|nr:sulfotransferase domain-containing protein [Methylobacterium trifolii]